MPTVSSGYKYALTGPPFNFLGHLCETQKTAFWKWLDKRTPWQSDISEWYRIRAHQLRKTAGLLEEYYTSKYPDIQESEALSATFQKDPWKPGTQGHFTYINRNDQEPAVTVSRIKDRYVHMLQKDDEGVFWMNWLRTQIELNEDKATFHKEAPSDVVKLKTDLDGLFNQPEYENVLVKNESDKYKGEPRFRINPLDEPTIYEKELFSHSKDAALSSTMTDTSGDL